MILAEVTPHLLFSESCLYAIAIAVGSCSFLMSYILKKKYDLPVLHAYFKFYGVLSTWFFLDVGLSYLKHILVVPLFKVVEYFLLIAINSCEILMLYCIPLFILRLIQHPKTEQWILVWAKIALSFFIALSLKAIFSLFFKIPAIAIEVFYAVLNTLFLTVIFLSLFQCKRYLSQHTPGKVTDIVRSMVVLTGVFFLGFILDFVRVGFISDLLHTYTVTRFLQETVTTRFYVLFYVIWSAIFLKNTLEILIRDIPTQEGDHAAALLKRHGITDREQEIVYGLAQGKSNQVIAEQLFISPLTVKRHIQNIYEKLAITNRVALLQKLHLTSMNMNFK